MAPSPLLPERPSVKVTYSGRAKRKQSVATLNEDSMPESSEGATIHQPSTGRVSSIVEGSVSAIKPPHSKGPKRVDVHLPGPSPNGVRPTSEESEGGGTSDLPSKVAETARRDVTESPRANLNSSKPASILGMRITKARSPKCSTTLDNNKDDISSVDNSPKKTRRTEAERIQFFKEQPECGEAEPHRVMCTRCNQWVNLGRKQTYPLRPWFKHRSRCDNVEVGGEADSDEDDRASTAAPSIVQSVQSDISVRRSESERKALLESDSRAESVMPDEALCRKCQKWIKLSNKVRYSHSHWISHQRRCSDSLPSSRVTMAERKLRIVNDSQAKAFTARSVECAACGDNIVLEGEVDYDLAKWEEHKVTCYASKESVERPLDLVKPTSATIRPPPSAVSTEGTLIAPDGGPSTSTRQVLKRPREPETDEEKSREDSDKRPQNRPRTENYKQVEKDPPGPFGWFLLPFQAFVQGFRESLRNDS